METLRVPVTTGLTVVDTNVLVAGVLTDHKEAPTARIVDGLLIAAISFSGTWSLHSISRSW